MAMEKKNEEAAINAENTAKEEEFSVQETICSAEFGCTDPEEND